MNTFIRFTVFLVLPLCGILFACAEEGTGDTETAETPDCGDHGSAHGGHCHCDEGYLFNGTTCVLPDQVTAVCVSPDAGVEEAHRDDACVCPEAGECSCDGSVETLSGRDYCLPELDHDEE